MDGATGAQPDDAARRSAPVPVLDPRPGREVQRRVRRGLPFRRLRRDPDAGSGAERERLCGALDDWYLDLVWIERQKCLLLTHTGTLFSVFRAGVRVADLRPLGNYLADAIETELRAEGLPTDTFSPLEPENVRRENREPQHARLHDRDGVRTRTDHHRQGRNPPQRHQRPQPRPPPNALEPRRLRAADQARQPTPQRARLTAPGSSRPLTAAGPSNADQSHLPPTSI